MYHVSAQGVDERIIDVHYYYCYHLRTLCDYKSRVSSDRIIAVVFNHNTSQVCLLITSPVMCVF